MKISPDLALEGKRFKEELSDAAARFPIFASQARCLASFCPVCFPFWPWCVRAGDVFEIASLRGGQANRMA
ncbi:hypothetical protein EOD00_14880 [Mesorhizobium sp. M7A.T.Ca.TU.009.01.3.1]|nr:hypothetical protein EOD00_14880 [Mesorhizobium sp. M7A.T.Ca.TU.009.01.3.1]